MRINFKQSLKMFHQEYYPDHNINEIDSVIKNAWSYIIDQLENGEYPEVRVKYLGKFYVKKGKAYFIRENIKNKFEKGNMDKSDFDKYMQSLDKYLEGY